MFALDTNAVIHFFKGNLTGGAGRMERLARFVSAITVLPFDARAAGVAAQIALHLQLLGQPIGPFDTLIAASAHARGATLVTHSSNEFSRVPGLIIEDWY